VRHLVTNQNNALLIEPSENVAAGLQDMAEAQKEKVTEEHNVIDEAIRDRGDGYTVFSIVSLVFWVLYFGSSRVGCCGCEGGYTVHPL
jgi:hypothetical protein